MRYHLAFKNFRPEIVAATETPFGLKPWREETSMVEKVAAAQDWLNAAVTFYNLPPVEYILMADSGLREGTFYEPKYGDGPDEVRATKFSIINLFTAFAQHRGEHSNTKAGSNPTGWGYSLFYRVKPEMFRARVREGRINGVTPADLLTVETLQRVRDAGLDPTAKDVLSQLARIDAGEVTDAGSVEELSAMDEEAALEALEDDAHEAELEPEDDEAEADEARTPVPTHTTGEDEAEGLQAVNTRELRRYATSQGLSGVWSMNKEQIIAALEGSNA
jgi:hypothetical protein